MDRFVAHDRSEPAATPPGVASGFSVVVPAYNTSATIGDALRSVLDQTVRDFQLLVVDDGSSDDTAERVARIDDPRLQLLRLEHRGAAAARNAGIAAAQGRYVAFLDSDDLWLPIFLARMGDALEANPDAGFAFTDAWVVDAETRRVRRTSVVRSRTVDDPPTDPGEFLRSLIEANFVYTSVCVRRDVLTRVGGFDETLQAGIDYELWLRVAAHGFRGVRAPGRLAVYRAGREGSISSSRQRVVRGLVAVYERVVERHPVGDIERERARVLLDERRRELSALEGTRSVDAMWLRLKPRLARLKHAILRDEGWYRTPPPEVAAVLESPSAATRRSPT
jgi:glycosyltransferase involved in cell wall biosynthesis